MESKQPGKNIWAFYPLMIVPGIVLLLAPSTVESVMNYYHFRESLGGLLQVSYFAGGVFGILLITRLMQRFDVRQMVLSQVALLSVSLLAASFAPGAAPDEVVYEAIIPSSANQPWTRLADRR